jgi:ATP-dependent DNA helicase RecQ
MHASTAPSLPERIIDLLRSRPGLKANEIARALGGNVSEINRLLYGPLKGQLHRDAAYRWSVSGRPEFTKPAANPPADTGTPVVTSEQEPNCPTCSRPMRLRTARRGPNSGGQFWGCSGYPDCEGTRPAGSDLDNQLGTQAEKSGASIKSVDWRESRARARWSAEYVPVGAVSSLFAKEFSANSNSSRLISQTLFLLNRNRPMPQVDELSAGILAVVEKILLRGRSPLPTLEVESAALRSSGLEHFVENLAGEGTELGWVWKGQPLPWSNSGLVDRVDFDGSDELAATPGLDGALLDSEYEDRFFGMVADLSPSLPHWLTPQVPMGNLLADVNADGRRVDFLFCHPDVPQPVVIEIDGSEHADSIDRQRDHALLVAGIKVIRIPNAEIEAGFGPQLEKALAIIGSVKKFSLDPDSTAWRVGRFAQECAWGAKLQLAVVRAIQNGWLSAAADCWRMRIDSPFSSSISAIRDLLTLLNAVERLYDGYILPGSVMLETSDRETICLSRDGEQWKEAQESRVAPDLADLVAIKLEPGASPWSAYPESPFDVVVRPAFAPLDFVPPPALGSRERLVMTADDATGEACLTQVLQMVFRKQRFREGQAVAISNALRGLDSIVLLPTGGGKSIIYQLSGLLSPGITLVIDPLVSLIEDQIRGLSLYGIDRAVGISSASGTGEERRRLLYAAERGEFMFILVAPERMQSPAFRDSLRAMSQVSRINLAVIDEAHCVSEWGHDFRPAYLNLPRNIRRLGEADGHSPTILALTGTASRAVLRDMVADIALDPHASNAIVRPSSFDRKELKFRIIGSDSRNAKVDLRGVLMSLPTEFRRAKGDFFTSAGRHTLSGLVFTQFVRPKDGGVIDLRENIKAATGAATTIYSGGSPLQSIGKGQWDQEKRENARRFMDNEVPIMVATKAFGMGIDKPNIRYTIHYGMPGSLEAFYQEAGRAGRDGHEALCVIIHSRPEADVERRLDLLRSSLSDLRANFEAQKNRNARGDLGAALFFHLSAFEGADKEISDVGEMLERIKALTAGQSMEIPFANEEDQKKREEKALFRLVQVGVLHDYEVDYGSKTLRLIGGQRDPNAIADRVIDYVRRSNPGRVPDIQARLAPLRASTGSDKTTAAMVAVLVEFCYDTIERARRRSIFEAMEAAKHGKDPANFRRRLLDYLQEGMDPESFQRLVEAEKVDFSICSEMIEKVNNPIEAGELRGITIRFLESYPEHPVLLALRAVSESLAADCNESVVFDSLTSLFGSAVGKYSVDRDGLENAVRLFANVAEQRAPRLFPSLLLAMEDAGFVAKDRVIELDALFERAKASGAEGVDDVLLVRGFRAGVLRVAETAAKYAPIS